MGSSHLPTLNGVFLSADCYANPLHCSFVPSLSSPFPRPIPQISSHLLVSRNEELLLPLMLPHQDTNLLRIPTGRIELGLSIEIFEQESNGCFHSIPFQLPQTYLINYRRWKDGLILCHLGMRVSSEIANYLVACDSHTDGSADGFAGYFSGDHVGIASYKAGEKLKDGDLEVGRGVGVDAVVSFDNDEASIVICGGSEGGGP